MVVIGINDINWSKEDFHPEDIVSFFSGDFPLLAMISEPSSASEGFELPVNQLICICGVNTQWAILRNPLFGSIKLPLTFPVKFFTRTSESVHTPALDLVNLTRAHGLPTMVHFEENFYIFHNDHEVSEESELRYVENNDEPRLSCVTINGTTTEQNIFLTRPCDRSFKAHIGLGFRKQSEADWHRFCSYLSKHPGKYVAKSKGMCSEKDLTFVLKYDVNDIMLDQNRDQLDKKLFGGIECRLSVIRSNSKITRKENMADKAHGNKEGEEEKCDVPTCSPVQKPKVPPRKTSSRQDCSDNKHEHVTSICKSLNNSVKECSMKDSPPTDAKILRLPKNVNTMDKAARGDAIAGDVINNSYERGNKTSPQLGHEENLMSERRTCSSVKPSSKSVTQTYATNQEEKSGKCKPKGKPSPPMRKLNLSSGIGGKVESPIISGKAKAGPMSKKTVRFNDVITPIGHMVQDKDANPADIQTASRQSQKSRVRNDLPMPLPRQ